MNELRAWSAAERESAERSANSWREFADGTELPRGDDELAAMGPVVEVQHRHENRLLGFDNVVGVAASYKVTAGRPSATPALAVLVETKQPLESVAAASRVPDRLDGVVTDVVAVGSVVPLVFNAETRPALPGFSIGHPNITAGTFGCVVHDLRDNGAELILSNNHVLANTNAAAIGDEILQPGPFDGGLFPADSVARLDRFEPIVFGAAGYNVVDAAVARPTHSRNLTASIIGQVVPRGIGQALVGLGVVKAGRTTQVTTGTVTATNATIAVNYGAPGTAVFRHQILTTAMSAGGDSGSLLMNRALAAVGLLFAGSSEITVFNHIADVETALGVRPVIAPAS